MTKTEKKINYIGKEHMIETQIRGYRFFTVFSDEPFVSKEALKRMLEKHIYNFTSRILSAGVRVLSDQTEGQNEN